MTGDSPPVAAYRNGPDESPDPIANHPDGPRTLPRHPPWFFVAADRTRIGCVLSHSRSPAHDKFYLLSRNYSWCPPPERLTLVNWIPASSNVCLMHPHLPSPHWYAPIYRCLIMKFCFTRDNSAGCSQGRPKSDPAHKPDFGPQFYQLWKKNFGALSCWKIPLAESKILQATASFVSPEFVIKIHCALIEYAFSKTHWPCIMESKHKTKFIADNSLPWKKLQIHHNFQYFSR